MSRSPRFLLGCRVEVIAFLLCNFLPLYPDIGRVIAVFHFFQLSSHFEHSSVCKKKINLVMATIHLITCSWYTLGSTTTGQAHLCCNTGARCFRDAFLDHVALPQHEVPSGLVASVLVFGNLLLRSAMARQAGERTPVMTAKWVPLLAAAALMSYTRLSLYAGSLRGSPSHGVWWC